MIFFDGVTGDGAEQRHRPMPAPKLPGRPRWC